MKQKIFVAKNHDDFLQIIEDFERKENIYLCESIYFPEGTSPFSEGISKENENISIVFTLQKEKGKPPFWVWKWHK